MRDAIRVERQIGAASRVGRRHTLGKVRTFILVGFVLLAVAGLWVLADWGGLSQRMPTQILPRHVARYPFAAGVALIVMGLVLGLSHGLG